MFVQSLEEKVYLVKAIFFGSKLIFGFFFLRGTKKTLRGKN